MKLKCSSELRWNSHCGHGRKTILNHGIDIILQFLYHKHREYYLKENNKATTDFILDYWGDRLKGKIEKLRQKGELK